MAYLWKKQLEYFGLLRFGCFTTMHLSVQKLPGWYLIHFIFNLLRKNVKVACCFLCFLGLRETPPPRPFMHDLEADARLSGGGGGVVEEIKAPVYILPLHTGFTPYWECLKSPTHAQESCAGIPTQCPKPRCGGRTQHSNRWNALALPGVIRSQRWY